MINKSIIIIISLFFYYSSSFGQKTDFESFAVKQDSLFLNAYNQKNTKIYAILLDEFIAKYEQLNTAEKKKYLNDYINAFYNFSCTWAIINNKAKALAYLEKSIKAGYYDYMHLLEDKDLENIRNEKNFKTVIAPLRETGDYLYILKKAGKYNPAEKRPIPDFTYQSANDTELVLVRKKFNLDSVAGFGNEISRLINLLHWVHNTVKHNGQQESGIKDINALEIINTSTSKGTGVSCGELATTLNDCYLAMGWKTRKVYCFPKDSLGVDFDSHVINIVYAASLKKWIWVDPTNDAYVMNEHGSLLSIREVRERLINNNPLILNPDANWNHRMSTVSQSYLYNYMAKNLYRFFSPLNSEYNYQTAKPGKTQIYVHLLPLDYSKQYPVKSESYDQDSKINFINYKTNNDGWFWKVPG